MSIKLVHFTNKACFFFFSTLVVILYFKIWFNLNKLRHGFNKKQQTKIFEFKTIIVLKHS